MVSIEHEKLLTQLLDMIDTSCQASLTLLQKYADGDEKTSASLLVDLRTAAQTVEKAQKPLLPQLEHAYAEEMAENIADTLDAIEQAAAANESGKAVMLMEFQLLPFLRLQREALYFWGSIFPDEKKTEEYYREEFAAHYRNFYVQDGEPAAYKLSVIVPAYNHLETSKQCVEHLLKETNFEKLNAELILIDHGSNDGTLEYFEGLGVGKVIHFKRNVRMYMFAMFAQICQGEYFCFVSNDVLVTRNWAEILLKCLDSDSRIIAAVPALPNIANLQIEEVPTNDPAQFVIWANQTNFSDSSRWYDRVRLMPPLGMYRTETVSRLGFADPYFYSMEFWDDDFSLRARRAGYRQIICHDVSCYHFGSVTSSEAWQKERTLQYGRELFRKKNGVDAWGNGFCFDYPAVQLLENTLSTKENIDFLALDCGFGDTPLQLRNKLRRQHRECRIYQLTTQKVYLPDLTSLFSEVRIVPWLSEAVENEFEGKLFSAAYLGRDIGYYEDFSILLKNLSARLKPGGVLMLACDNPFYMRSLHTLLQFSLPNHAEQYVFIDPERVKEEAKKYFSAVQTVVVENPINGINKFIKMVYGKPKNLTKIQKTLAAQKIYFLCQI